MPSRRTLWAGWALLVAWQAGAAAFAQEAAQSAVVAPPQVSVDDLTPEFRARVSAVLDQPTLRARGRVETFTCQPGVYDWLLDHPELGVRLWRLLGAKCSEITAEGGDRYTWKEGPSSVHWDTVLKQPGLRVWYAEGEVRPGMFLPGAKVKAVAILRYAEVRLSDGRPTMRHQVELSLHTDSHAVALATRILGASAPRAGEQVAGQIEMFYAALAWYLDQHPRHAEAMFAQLRRPASTDSAAKLTTKSGN